MTQKEKIITLVFLLLLLAIKSQGQYDKEKEQLYEFADFYSKGDFTNAENCLKDLEKKKTQLSKELLIALYNNLGVVNNLLGRFDEALHYLNLAESLIKNDDLYLTELADIYCNKARIYGVKKESNNAIEYLEQAIKIYSEENNPNISNLFSLSTAYLNLGLNFFRNDNNQKAVFYLKKSIKIKVQYNLQDKGLPILNLAKVYSKLGQTKVAHDYYLRCIEYFKKENGITYYRLADVYFDYGIFLRTIGKSDESLEILQKALDICLKNYGDKHTFVSLAYKLLGDFYLNSKDYPKALDYYQKSLIAVVVDFNDSNIESNPSLSSVLFDIRLLENLKSKAKALEAFSQQQVDNAKKLHLLKKSFETIELSLKLIARIRSGYITPESKFYLAENEKQTYFFAVSLAQKLYETTNEQSYKNKMYSIACLSKAAVLLNDIAESNAISKYDNSDSLNIKYRKLLIDISSFSKLIEDEIIKSNPDKSKVDFWKSSLFELNQKKEKMYGAIKGLYPYNVLRKTEPLGLGEIQRSLEGDETIVDFFLSNSINDSGQRGLYLFTISRNKLNYRYALLDSSVIKKMRIIKDGTSFNSNVSNYVFASALFCMYETLIKPIESDIVGENIFIIPDEDIAYLPFDSFIKKKPNSNTVSFDELEYLIYDYTFSYGYTSSLLGHAKPNEEPSVITFHPEYSFDKVNGGYTALHGASNEILEISNFFRTERLSANEATESKFISKIDGSSILHLAMHSTIDKNDSRYSYLVFDSINDKQNDGRLYNYEIGNLRIKSPMVVLSACNTGDGNLIEGEGIMSLTRGFFLAGVPSVICTYWDVNDAASKKIMEEFYYNLSKGDKKSVALRKAKLDYLSKNPPLYSKPSYWAAYEVFGNISPVKQIHKYSYYFLIALLSTGLITVIYYFRRFRRS